MLGAVLVSDGYAAGELGQFERDWISEERAEQVVGGIDADIKWPGTNNYFQSYDNLRFKVDVTSEYYSQVEVGAWTNVFGWVVSTGSSVVSLPGQFHRRVDWPYANGSKFDVIMRFKDGDWYDCGGNNPSDTDQYLHADVKVHTVQIHNTKDGTFEGTWTAASVKKIVDRIDAAIPNAQSNTIDGIYGQCGSMIGTVKKTQWRRASVNTIAVDAGCSDLNEVLASCGVGCDLDGAANCQPFVDCIDDMMSKAGHTNNDYAHVYVVDTIRCGDYGGYTFKVNPGNVPFIVILNSHGPQYSESTGARTLTHELAHGVGLNHIDDTSWEDCSNSIPNRNLMCTAGGRLLQNTDLPRQCDDIRSSTVYDDWN